MENTQPTFACVGIAMQQPKDAPNEGYVACYRAGHGCPPMLPYRYGDTICYRCPCCGDRGISFSAPPGEPLPDVPASIRGGLILDASGVDGRTEQ